MDKKFKAKWVKALRSGKFIQGRYRLCSFEGHLCCIGVGAVIADKNFKPTSETLTTDAVIILGITDDQKDALVELNDTQEQSFAEIADYIEQNL